MIRTLFIFIGVFFYCSPALAQFSKYVSSESDISKTETFVFDERDLITPILERNFQNALQESGQQTGFTSRSEVVFLSSAVLPGSGQIMNRNWLKAGLFMAIEAASIYYMVDYNKRGRRGERNYENWADDNWSVVQYSNWLVQYHDVHGIDNPYLNQLREMVDGTSASFNTETEWAKINLDILRNVERNTPYITTDDAAARNFSHVLPNYGSQQYYELIAKYYQYQAGWKDYDQFHNNLGHTGSQFNERYLIDRNGDFASPLFFEGVDRAAQFNSDFRTGRNFMSLLIVNHVLSAFDAYFTLKIRQNRLQATSGLSPNQQIKLSFSF